MRTLSSSLTFLYKFIFPVWWIGWFAFVTAAMFVAPNSFTPRGNAQMSVEEARMFFLAATIVGGMGLYWLCMRLKKVTLKENDLVISNFRKVVGVPLQDVERVSGSVLIHPELVWLHFRRPNGFGSKVVFMGKARFSFGLSVHPIVRELQAVIGKASR